MSGTSEFVINNVRIFDGTDVLPGTHNVTISDGSITSISDTLASPTPPGSNNTTVIDGTGCSLIPGLIDSHIHVTTPSELDALASHGVTAACDMACFPASLLSQVRSYTTSSTSNSNSNSSPPRPHLLSAGTPATSPGSTHSHIPGMPAEALLTDPADAERFVHDRLTADQSDYVKLVADVPGPSQALLDALAAAARAKGLRAVVHAAALEPFRMAVRSGADCVTHAPMDAAIDEGLAAELRDRDGAVVPTLAMMENVSARREKLGLEPAIESVRILHRAGVRLLAGTDANSLPGMAVKHGESLVRELELEVRAGLSPVEALRSATSLPAEYWGLEGRGKVGVGMRADLVLVEGEPWSDVSVLRKVRTVYIGGRPVV